MISTLTITYDKSNEDIPVLCVGESDLFSITIIKVFTGEKAEQLYKELTGQNVLISESEDKTDKNTNNTIGTGELYEGEFEYGKYGEGH